MENFDKMKTFVKSIVSSFDVDNLLTRVSVITYDSNARLDIAFTDYRTQEPLLQRIEELRFVGGESSRMDLALKKASDTIFSGDDKARRKVSIYLYTGL